MIYNSLRAEVCDVCADQGREAGLADTDTLRPKWEGSNPFDDRYARMYPNALWMPEYLHIIFNALENSITKLPNHHSFMTRLKHLENFLADRSLRRLFMNACVEPVLHKEFEHYSTVHISWRWEVLVKALDHLIPRFQLMKERFNVEKIERQPDGKVDSQLVKEAHATLSSELFIEFCVLVRSSGSILQRYAHALGGCQCHAEIWKEKSSWKSKKRKMELLTGSATCFMKGRQAGWWFARGFDQCVGDLRKGDSTLFQNMLAKLDPRTRGEFVKLQTQLADSLAEEFQEKYFFKDVIPYSIIKVFYESEIAGGSQEKLELH